MNHRPDPGEVKRRVTAAFDAIAGNYETLGFVRVCAKRIVELADLRPGERVLDVATGTGLVAVMASRLVGPGGRVVGVDISPEMLAGARAKAAAAGAASIEFHEGDAETLHSADASFDVALCASALFFMPDMLGALREWRVLVPGGRAGFSSFGPTFLEPLHPLWLARLERHGLTLPPPPVERLSDPEVCRRFLLEAGYTDPVVRSEQLGYYFQTAEERWGEIMAGLEGLPLRPLPPEQREQIKQEHLAELRRLATPDGIWVDGPAHFAFGRKAG